MGCGKLAIAILLALFFLQQYSSASPTAEQNANANGGNQPTINTPATQALGQAISERFFQINTSPQFCIGAAADLLRDQLAFVPQISQGVTNALAVTYDLLQCAQAGSFPVTFRCLQNVSQRLQTTVNTTIQHQMQLLTTFSNGVRTLFTCLTTPPLP